MAETRIGEMLIPEIDTIAPEESVRIARRRMESQTRRSLIVVDEGRPVGVIQWRDIMRVEDAGADQLVADHMVREFPVLRADMSVDEARTGLGEVDFDRLPVVDADGRLMGEVPRSAIAQYGETVESVPTAEPGTSPYPWPSDRGGGTIAEAPAQPSLRSGLAVIGSEGNKLGTVEDIVLQPSGEVQAFTVKHGLLGRKHKRLPGDLVDRVEEDQAYLRIDVTEFKMLADIESQEV